MAWCKCTQCSRSPAGGTEVSRQVASQHRKRDRRAAADSSSDGEYGERGDEEASGKDVPPITLQEEDLEKAISPALQLCLAFVLWLNLSVGLSRDISGKVLKGLSFILSTLFLSFVRVLRAAGVSVSSPTTSPLPADIRTLYDDDLEPDIERTVCCPECYTMYPADKPIPDICKWRKNPRRGKFCNTELWKLRKTRSGEKRVPKRYFSSVSDSQARNERGYPTEMTDVRESPAWQSLGNYIIVLALIGDLAAIRKIAGFKAHNATMFCSHCLLQYSNLGNLDWDHWVYRDGKEVKDIGRKWLGLNSTKAREALSKETGVRWTPIHNLIGWDPVKRLVIGFMHNSLEGMAENHLREVWGIGRSKRFSKKLAAQEAFKEFAGDDADLSESEMTTASESSQDLHPGQAAPGQPDEMDVDEPDSDSDSNTPTPQNQHLRDHAESLANDNLDDDDDDIEYGPGDIFNFSKEELELIRGCIATVHLPTWVGRPPSNLGRGPVAESLLDNFYHLVACTAIISFFRTSPSLATRYMYHLIEYRKSLKELFSFFPQKPNFHMAMHNHSQLSWFGPLAALNEFAGERLNGLLASVKTNRRKGDMEFTMLQTTARRARFEATLNDARVEDSLLEEVHMLKKGIELEPEQYARVLQYLHSIGQTQWTSWLDDVGSLMDDGDLVLPPHALMPSEFKLDERTYSRKTSLRGK
ncbi:hypothetical protein C8F01DRAFT_1345766 [Mycena amicta]|nr:hypothetical protein C8F01DRAFT_1345766 [Mycena amicta]